MREWSEWNYQSYSPVLENETRFPFVQLDWLVRYSWAYILKEGSGLVVYEITRSLMPHLTCHESRCNTRILLILKAEIFDYNGLFVHKYELSSPTDPNPQNVCVPFYDVLDWTVWACKWNGTHSRTLQPMFHHKLYIICRLMIWNMVFESAVRCTWNMFRLLFSSGIFSITAPLRSQLLSGRPCGKPGF